MTRDPEKERLQSDDQAKVDQGEYARQSAIHQCMFDQQVDVEEPVAKDGGCYPQRKCKEQQPQRLLVHTRETNAGMDTRFPGVITL